MIINFTRNYIQFVFYSINRLKAYRMYVFLSQLNTIFKIVTFNYRALLNILTSDSTVYSTTSRFRMLPSTAHHTLNIPCHRNVRQLSKNCFRRNPLCSQMCSFHIEHPNPSQRPLRNGIQVVLTGGAARRWWCSPFAEGHRDGKIFGTDERTSRAPSSTLSCELLTWFKFHRINIELEGLHG